MYQQPLVWSTILLSRLGTSYGIRQLSYMDAILFADSCRQWRIIVVFYIVPWCTTGISPRSVIDFSFLYGRHKRFALYHGLLSYFYADDTQLQFSGPCEKRASLLDQLSLCIDEIDEWITSKCLILNQDKTDILCNATKYRLSRIDTSPINLTGALITPSVICDLGFNMLI